MNNPVLTGLVVGPQCPRVFRQKRAPRKNLPSVIAIREELTPTPTRLEIRHG